MAWKKPFFKRVSSKISTRMLNLMTLPRGAREKEASPCAIWPRIYRAAPVMTEKTGWVIKAASIKYRSP
jgi:hypothetical protein